jgi:hypothetical protein
MAPTGTGLFSSCYGVISSASGPSKLASPCSTCLDPRTFEWRGCKTKRHSSAGVLALQVSSKQPLQSHLPRHNLLNFSYNSQDIPSLMPTCVSCCCLAGCPTAAVKTSRRSSRKILDLIGEWERSGLKASWLIMTFVQIGGIGATQVVLDVTPATTVASTFKSKAEIMTQMVIFVGFGAMSCVHVQEERHIR